MLMVMVVRINGTWNRCPMSTTASHVRSGEYYEKKKQTDRQIRARKLETRSERQQPFAKGKR